MAMDEKGLGKRLQDARRAAGFTQQSLCHKAGLSYSTLAKIERGAIKSPSIFTIQQIAAALGVGLDTLLGLPGGGPQKQTAANGVKFVYFDVNGCLVHFFQRAFTRIAHECGLTVDEVESTFWHFNDDVCRGKITMAAFNEATAKQLRLPSLDWEFYYLEAVEPIAGMQELVKWASEHYRVGLMSNIMPGFLDAMLARELLPGVQYDAIIDSSEVKAIKPEQKIYEIAAEKAGVKPSEILLVDDARANLMAAERCGWHVLWFDDYRPKEAIERIKKALA